MCRFGWDFNYNKYLADIKAEDIEYIKLNPRKIQ